MNNDGIFYGGIIGFVIGLLMGALDPGPFGSYMTTVGMVFVGMSVGWVFWGLLSLKSPLTRKSSSDKELDNE